MITSHYDLERRLAALKRLVPNDPSYYCAPDVEQRIVDIGEELYNFDGLKVLRAMHGSITNALRPYGGPALRQLWAKWFG